MVPLIRNTVDTPKSSHQRLSALCMLDGQYVAPQPHQSSIQPVLLYSSMCFFKILSGSPARPNSPASQAQLLSAPSTPNLTETRQPVHHSPTQQIILTHSRCRYRTSSSGGAVCMQRALSSVNCHVLSTTTNSKATLTISDPSQDEPSVQHLPSPKLSSQRTFCCSRQTCEMFRTSLEPSGWGSREVLGGTAGRCMMQWGREYEP